MIFSSIKFKGHRCFKDDWAGFDHIKPINVIIGRNNSGKSQLLDLAEALCAEDFPRKAKNWELNVAMKFTEQALQACFNPNSSGGTLNGNHWTMHGVHLVGQCAHAVIQNGKEAAEVIFSSPDEIWAGVPTHYRDPRVIDARMAVLRSAVLRGESPLKGHVFRRISAERDVVAEPSSKDLSLAPNGRGATNIIRRYLNTSHPNYPREHVQKELRDALNEVFHPDGEFAELETNQHDEEHEGANQSDMWEIYLTEERKGRIALSRSGSGLKTVILVLLNLLIVPAMLRKPKDKFVFGFEELENNLHPALLRRLFRFIEKYVAAHNATVFLTTHSSVALDVFGVSPKAQIVHVMHNGASASTRTISAHFEKTGVIAELGAKPSDLLHANGVVWVEGPSDRIYLNRWIELASSGALKEGRDYVCAFYGGALLANDQFAAPEDADSDLSNLLRVNGNIVVVCDSDRTAATGDGAELKGRVVRIKAEVEKIPSACLWITDTKEIENYLPTGALRKVFADQTLIAPEPRQRFFPPEKGEASSYVEKALKRKSVDKVALAARVAREMTLEQMKERFDWDAQVGKVVATITNWNR